MCILYVLFKLYCLCGGNSNSDHSPAPSCHFIHFFLLLFRCVFFILCFVLDFLLHSFTYTPLWAVCLCGKCYHCACMHASKQVNLLGANNFQYKWQIWKIAYHTHARTRSSLSTLWTLNLVFCRFPHHFRHKNVERISEFLMKAFKRPIVHTNEFVFALFEFDCFNIDKIKKVNRAISQQYIRRSFLTLGAFEPKIAWMFSIDRRNKTIWKCSKLIKNRTVFQLLNMRPKLTHNVYVCIPY